MADLPRFDLGQAGVVLTSTPLHGDPGQLTKGQNVEFLRAGGLGGVGSRGPLQPYTSQMLQQDGVTPGPVLAAIEVPLPSPLDNGETTILLFSTTGVLKSTDGHTFTGSALPLLASDTGAANNGAVSAFVGPYDQTSNTTQVRVNNTTVTVPGDVQSIVSLNGNFYVSVITSGQNVIRTARKGFSGHTYTLSIPQGPSAPVTGAVYEISYPALAQRQIGESFGGQGASLINAFDSYSNSSGRQDGVVTAGNVLPIGPTGAAPGPLAVGAASGRLYVAYGVFYENGGSGSHFSDNVRLGVDYLAIDPTDLTASWRDIVLTKIGLPGTAFGTSPTANTPITCQPSLLIADTFASDEPWWGSFAPDPFAVSSSTLGSGAGDVPGGQVYSGYATSTKKFNDPQGGSNPDFAGFMFPIMFNGAIYFAYVSYTNYGSDPSTVKIYKASLNDASTVTEELNVLTAVISAPHGGPIPNHHCYPGQPYLFDDGGGDALYWPMYAPAGSGFETQGFLLKRDAAAVWWVVVTGVALAGPSTVYTVIP